MGVMVWNSNNWHHNETMFKNNNTDNVNHYYEKHTRLVMVY